MPDRNKTPRSHHQGAAGDWPGQPVYADRAAEAPGQAPDEGPADVELLRNQLETAKTLAAEHLASLQRTAADFANFKRRTAEDRERELGLASESLLRKLLAIVDDFDRALDSMPAELKGVGWMEGIVLLDRKLRQLLESEGVTPIESVGRPFDPHEHEAIASVPATGRPDGEVVAEVQRGYRVRNRILRPAMVAVASGSAAPGDASSHSN
jgi:molecular chaperone GrpE